MIDPHDYELTEEEHEALVLISEHAIVPPLSPAAKAVLSAYRNSLATEPYTTSGRIEVAVAAALRAAADQVFMKQPLGDTDADAGVFAAHNAISAALLAIAAELEGL